MLDLTSNVRKPRRVFSKNEFDYGLAEESIVKIDVGDLGQPVYYLFEMLAS